MNDTEKNAAKAKINEWAKDEDLKNYIIAIATLLRGRLN